MHMDDAWYVYIYIGLLIFYIYVYTHHACMCMGASYYYSMSGMCVYSRTYVRVIVYTHTRIYSARRC
jgi:hypothetical protein